MCVCQSLALPIAIALQAGLGASLIAKNRGDIHSEIRLTLYSFFLSLIIVFFFFIASLNYQTYIHL